MCALAPHDACILQEKVFSVLFRIRLVTWEEDHKVLDALFLFLEWAQLALFLVDPVFGWDIPWDGCARRARASSLRFISHPFPPPPLPCPLRATALSHERPPGARLLLSGLSTG